LSSTGTDRWHALHVYLPHSVQTRFLREVVDPVLRDAGLRDRFFFLRYWQGGPHLRLRMHGASGATVASIRQALASAVPAGTPELAAEYAYEVSLQAQLAEREREQPAPERAAGTVEEADYRPEYGKYGGPAGIRIAERLFGRTSAAVLDLIGARADPAPRAPVGDAIRVMAMSLRGSGLDAERSRAFLERYEQWWRPYVPPGSDRTWPGLYDRTRDRIRHLCEAVWHGDATDTFHDTYAEALTEARRIGGPHGDLADLTLGTTTYARCLAHYLHTTNNRLGIIPAGEAFLAHVMCRSLTELEPA